MSRGNPIASMIQHDAEEGLELNGGDMVARLVYAAEGGRLIPHQIGFGMDALPIVVPERGEMRNPQAWRPTREWK